jgi:hypothetical protein
MEGMQGRCQVGTGATGASSEDLACHGLEEHIWGMRCRYSECHAVPQNFKSLARISTKGFGWYGSIFPMCGFSYFYG